MNNINPIYFIEGRFIDSFKKFWNADKNFTSKRYFGGRGKELFNTTKSVRKNGNDAIKNMAGANLDAEILGNKISASDKAKYLDDLENYIQSKENWNQAKSELWDETKQLPGRLWKKIKGDGSKANTNPIYVNNSGSSLVFPAVVGATGLGLYGAKTIADELASSSVKNN